MKFGTTPENYVMLVNRGLGGVQGVDVGHGAAAKSIRAIAWAGAPTLITRAERPGGRSPGLSSCRTLRETRWRPGVETRRLIATCLQSNTLLAERVNMRQMLSAGTGSAQAM